VNIVVVSPGLRIWLRRSGKGIPWEAVRGFDITLVYSSFRIISSCPLNEQINRLIFSYQSVASRKFLRAGRFLPPSTFQVFVFSLLLNPTHLSPAVVSPGMRIWLVRSGERSLGRRYGGV
jgi:hypothetical protein